MVDSSVLLDLFTEDSGWSEWSEQHLAEAWDRGALIVNQVVWAEVSVRFPTIEEMDAILPSAVFRRVDVPWDAAFLAGKCFLEYRRRGGTRAATLPDFFIGAHAAVARVPLLTRDPRRIRSYLPGVELICP